MRTPTSTRARLLTASLALASLTAGVSTALAADWGHGAPPAAAPAPAVVVPLDLTPVAAPTTPAAPPAELPAASDTAQAFAAAKAATGVTPAAYTALPLPAWATPPTQSRHPYVVPAGAAIHVSATPGGAAARTYAARTAKDADLALLELGRQKAADGSEWVKVLLPERPNGTFGWAPAAETVTRQTPWSLQVHQKQHRLLAFYGTTLVRSLSVAVGAPATFTPDGLFFVDVVVDTGNPAGAYGRWILGLNGFSEVYDTFGDGDALIGIHGTNVPSSFGTSVSHGCVRAPNPEVAALAHLVPLGTPVEISP